ncbi:MAG TPA: GTP-binding protein [Limnobacter sp.]|uniref:GTP-binding protein n=1 Tax=Limnobacter sp. TaxID=2003368 RepID=UPI002EDA655E
MVAPSPTKTLLWLVAGRSPQARAQAIESLLQQRPPQGKTTLLANSELFSVLSVEEQARVFDADQALKAQGIHLLRLAPGCACCSSKLMLSTHLGRTLRLNQPDWLILELDSQSHVAQVQALLNEPQWQPWFSEVLLKEGNDG